MPIRLSARHSARRCSAEAVQTTMRPKLWLTSLLAAAGASEQEIRLTRGIVQNAASERRPPAPPAGPAALLPFRGRCVSTKLGADDLRVCPFANATQTSLAGAEFVLGVFSTFRGRSLVYADGDVCGAAPRNAAAIAVSARHAVSQ